MSDRLTTDLYTIWDRGRHGISWEDSWVQDVLDDVAPDLVSEIRSRVESGTIKGEVVEALPTPYLLILLSAGGPCDHAWVDATNEVISSGEWCPKCNAIRGPVSDGPKGDGLPSAGQRMAARLAAHISPRTSETPEQYNERLAWIANDLMAVIGPVSDGGEDRP